MWYTVVMMDVMASLSKNSNSYNDKNNGMVDYTIDEMSLIPQRNGLFSRIIDV